jgi:lambda family phage tail tape measure protein
MAESFASLGIQIDSSQVRQATSDLDKLAAIGGKVEKGIVQATNAEAKLNKTLDAGAKAARDNAKSIDAYVANLQKVAATNGLSGRQIKLYELALQGANKAQLQAADSALRLTDSYRKGLAIGQQYRDNLASIAKYGGLIATAAATASVAIAKSQISALAELKDTAEITGSSIENISALDRIARETGAGINTVSESLVKFNQVLSSANGKDDASRVFKALNLDIKELKALDPAEAMRQTAAALDKYADDGNKARAIQELFGKSVKEVAPFLRDLAEQTRLQGTASAKSAEQADEFQKSLSRLKANSEDAARSIVSEFLPALNGILQTFNNGGLMAALDDFGERAFGWTSNANAKRIKTLQSDITNLKEAAGSITFDVFGQKGKIQQEIDAKTSELRSVANSFLRNDKGYGDRTIAIAQDKKDEKPTIKVPPKPLGGGSKGDTAEQIARAQLGYDLDDIRKASDATIAEFTRTQSILEAKRSAGLVEEKDYYAQRRQLAIESNQAAQEGLEREIARLQAEKVSGKEAIDNQRKILDAQSKLTKARQDGATALQVLAIQEEGAAKRISDAYDRATESAKGYLDTVARNYGREIAGFGVGNKNRQDLAALGAIDDRRQQQEIQLQGELRRREINEETHRQEVALARDTYAKEIALYQERTKKLEELQKNWLYGATEALHNYADEAGNVAKHAEETLGNAFRGLEDQLTNLLTGKKFDADALASSIAADAARSVVKEGITGPLASALGGFLGGSDGGIGGATAAASTAAMAASATAATTSLAALTAAATSAAAALAASSASSAAGVFGSAAAVGSSLNFADGGFTGAGGKYQPAGIVHAGEYVVNAENTRRLGLGFLERLNRRGYAEGGFVSPFAGSSSVVNNAPRGGDYNQVLNINVKGNVDNRTATQIAKEAYLLSRTAYMRNG